jgi:sulfate transport system substrate-binding protein
VITPTRSPPAGPLVRHGRYGAQIEQGKSPEQAVAYLEQLFRNVPVQDKSAREALQTFVGGKGDVMLAYENEAINAQAEGPAGRLHDPRPDRS